FRSGSTDAGLNIFSYSPTGTTTFTAGELAFVGTATWSISPALYTAMLTAPDAGDIHFPADDITDLPTAQVLGTYSVLFPPPQPPTIVVDPTELESTQTPDAVVELDLSIHNDGDENLDWTITETAFAGQSLG